MSHRRRLRRSVLPSLLYSGGALPTFIGCLLIAWPDTRVAGAIGLAVGVALFALPTATVDDSMVRYGFWPVVRSVPLASIDAFEAIGIGARASLGYCRRGTLERTPIWVSRQTTGDRRDEWVSLLNDQLRRARGTLPTLDQRALTGRIHVRPLLGVTSSPGHLGRRLYLFDRDPRPDDLPRFGVAVPSDFPAVRGEPVEVFGDATTGDVIVRICSTGYEYRPLGRMVGTPARAPRWIETSRP